MASVTELSDSLFNEVETVDSGMFLQRTFLTFLFLFFVFFHCPVMFLKRYIWHCDHPFFIPMKVCLFVWTITLSIMLPHAGPQVFNSFFYLPIILTGLAFYVIYRLFDIFYSYTWYPHFREHRRATAKLDVEQNGRSLPTQTGLQKLNFNLRMLGLVVIALVLFELWYFGQYAGHLITYLLLSSIVLIFYISESILQAVLIAPYPKRGID